MNNALKQTNKILQKFIFFSAIAGLTRYFQILCDVFAAFGYWQNVVKVNFRNFKVFSAKVTFVVIAFHYFKTVNFFISHGVNFCPSFCCQFGAFSWVSFIISLNTGFESAAPYWRFFTRKTLLQKNGFTFSGTKAGCVLFSGFNPIFNKTNFTSFNNWRVQSGLSAFIGTILSFGARWLDLFIFAANDTRNYERRFLVIHLATARTVFCSCFKPSPRKGFVAINTLERHGHNFIIDCIWRKRNA